MTHPQPDVLAGLVLEPTDGDPELREHVAGCPDCARLVERLRAVRSTAAAAEELVAPPDAVRARVLAEIAGDRDRALVVPLVPQRTSRRGIPAWAAGIAAAVALLAGLGLGRLTVAEPEQDLQPDSPGTVLAAADLTALDSDDPRGDAEAVADADDVVTVSVRASSLGDEPGFHEVWLINVDGERMVALGILARGDDGSFEVPRELIDQGYRILDISVEPDDGDPTHSGVSLARGELA